MGENSSLQYWEVWYPKAGATGISVARGLIEPAQRVILHAAPEVLTVEVSDENGTRLAYGRDLERTDETPMCSLYQEGNKILRKDIWPDESDLQSIVLLPGGEAGTLLSWWNADDRKEWRWQVEFYNSIRK